MLHHVPVRVFDVYDDHVGPERLDDPGDTVNLMDHGDLAVSCFAQSFLDDRGADGVLVNHKNGEVAMGHAVS